MKVYTTAPLEDPRDVAATFERLEAIGYDGGFTFEAKHDPFLPLVLAADRTQHLRLGTAIAIAFARSPMNLANLAYGLQSLSGGRLHRSSIQYAEVAARTHAARPGEGPGEVGAVP